MSPETGEVLFNPPEHAQAMALRDLRAATNVALAAIQSSKVDGPINWGDLQCVEARFINTNAGLGYFSVLMEEAASDATELHKAVAAHLAGQGWPNVSVETEW